jgi:sucrose-6-phosphatase
VLDQKQIPANIITSVDDAENLNLIDILPPRANKLLAIRFLIRKQGMHESRVVFAGDSGNDLDVLTSGMQAILVGNAAPDVRETATDRLKEKGQVARLYLAKGDFHGMNGNYAAGVMEGVVHFFPETASWF